MNHPANAALNIDEISDGENIESVREGGNQHSTAERQIKMSCRNDRGAREVK